MTHCFGSRLNHVAAKATISVAMLNGLHLTLDVESSELNLAWQRLSEAWLQLSHQRLCMDAGRHTLHLWIRRIFQDRLPQSADQLQDKLSIALPTRLKSMNTACTKDTFRSASQWLIGPLNLTENSHLIL